MTRTKSAAGGPVGDQRHPCHRRGPRQAGCGTTSDLLFVRPTAEAQVLVILNAPSTQVGALLKEREQAGWSLAAVGHIRVMGDRIKVLDASNLGSP